MAEKNTSVPASVVEHTLADAIRESVVVSGLFNGNPVEVYCATDEDFALKLQSDINGALGQTVRVAYAGRDSLEFTDRIVENGRVTVTVASPLLMANSAPESSVSLADAIDTALTGTVFEAPFTPMPVICNTSFYTIDEVTKRYTATLTFSVKFILRESF